MNWRRDAARTRRRGRPRYVPRRQFATPDGIPSFLSLLRIFAATPFRSHPFSRVSHISRFIGLAPRLPPAPVLCCHRRMPKRAIAEFIQHWSAASPSERANSQPFLLDLCCDRLGVSTSEAHPASGCFFEFPVVEYYGGREEKPNFGPALTMSNHSELDGRPGVRRLTRRGVVTVITCLRPRARGIAGKSGVASCS